MKPRLQYILFHFFLNSCILFSLIFFFFSFHTHSYANKSQYFPKRAATASEELLKARERQRAGHGHAIAALWVAYSHHGELPAELCPALLDANFFTSYSSFSCKHCRKVKTAERPRLTFLYLWNQHILWETWNLKPSTCFLKHQEGQGFVKELGSETWTSLKTHISALISNVLTPVGKKLTVK